VWYDGALAARAGDAGQRSTRPPRLLLLLLRLQSHHDGSRVVALPPLPPYVVSLSAAVRTRDLISDWPGRSGPRLRHQPRRHAYLHTAHHWRYPRNHYRIHPGLTSIITPRLTLRSTVYLHGVMNAA